MNKKMAPSHWESLIEDLFLRVLDCFDYKERYILGMGKLCASALNIRLLNIDRRRFSKSFASKSQFRDARQFPASPGQDACSFILNQKMEFVRRVRDTVLVCKRWSTLCLQNPPQHAELAFQLQDTTAPSYLTWLAQSSQRAEKLSISIADAQVFDEEFEEQYPLLPQQSLNSLLGLLFTGSSMLRTLAIIGPHNQDEFIHLEDYDYMEQGYTWDHWVGSLQLLRQLEHLILAVEFVPGREQLNPVPENFFTAPQDFFTDMNLKVISCHCFHWLKVCMSDAKTSMRPQFGECHQLRGGHKRFRVQYSDTRFEGPNGRMSRWYLVTDCHNQGNYLNCACFALHPKAVDSYPSLYSSLFASANLLTGNLNICSRCLWK